MTPAERRRDRKRAERRADRKDRKSGASTQRHRYQRAPGVHPALAPALGPFPRPGGIPVPPLDGVVRAREAAKYLKCLPEPAPIGIGGADQADAPTSPPVDDAGGEDVALLTTIGPREGEAGGFEPKFLTWSDDTMHALDELRKVQSLIWRGMCL